MSIQTKACPFCKNDIDKKSIICSLCGHHFNVVEDDGTESSFLVSVQQLPVPYRVLMVAACVFLIFGSLLPWGMMETFMGSLEIKGAAGDGILTAMIGAILLVISLLSDKYSKDRRLAMIAGGVLSLILLIPKLVTLMKPTYESKVYIGLVLALFGAVLVLISALITRQKDVPL